MTHYQTMNLGELFCSHFTCLSLPFLHSETALVPVWSSNSLAGWTHSGSKIGDEQMGWVKTQISLKCYSCRSAPAVSLLSLFYLGRIPDQVHLLLICNLRGDFKPQALSNSSPDCVCLFTWSQPCLYVTWFCSEVKLDEFFFSPKTFRPLFRGFH